MGPQEDYIETVLTCEGDFYDPEFHQQLHNFSKRLQELITSGQRQLILKKVEPWNSVRVTFNIPKEAAVRLKQLAEQGDETLRGLGILAVQIEGDRVISLTIQGKNNETTELVFTTPGPSSTGAAGAGSVYDISSADELNLPGPSNVEATRKNIAEYLSQQGTGPGFLHSFLSQQTPGLDLKAGPSGSVPSTEPLPLKPSVQTSGFPSFGSPSRSPSHSVTQAAAGRSPAGFPSPSSAGQSQQSFPSPGSQRGQLSPMSPKYPTPPPSVPPPHPSSPCMRVTQQLQQQQQQQLQQQHKQQQLQQQQLQHQQHLQQQQLQQQQLQQQQQQQPQPPASSAAPQTPAPPPAPQQVGHQAPQQQSQQLQQQQQQQQQQQPFQPSPLPQQQQQQNFGGLPFPHGSPNVNNLQQRVLPNKDITSSSPLLVNLLQSDVPGGHFNHLPQHKMPPPFDTGPPAVKRKRRPRKPKDGSSKLAKTIESELGLRDGVSSPVLNQESRVPPTGLEMMAQPLPSSSGSPLSTMSPALTGSNTPPLQNMGTKSPVRSSPDKSGNPQHIINPYTGQLEPRESRVDTVMKAEDHRNVHNDSNSTSFSDADSSAGFLDTAPQLRPPSNPMVDIKSRLAANQNPQQPHHPPFSPRQSSPRSDFRPGPSQGPYGPPPHPYSRVSTPPASIQESMLSRNCSQSGNPHPGGNNTFPGTNTNIHWRLPFSGASPVSLPNTGAPAHMAVPTQQQQQQRLPFSAGSSSIRLSMGMSLGQPQPGAQVSPLMASSATPGLPPPPPYTRATATSSGPQDSRVRSPIVAQAAALSSALAAPPLVEPTLVPPRLSHPHTLNLNNDIPSSVSSTQQCTTAAAMSTVITTCVASTVSICTTSTITSTPTVCSLSVSHDNGPVTTSCTASSSLSTPLSAAPLIASSHTHNSNSQKAEGTSSTISTTASTHTTFSSSIIQQNDTERTKQGELNSAMRSMPSPKVTGQSPLCSREATGNGPSVSDNHDDKMGGGHSHTQHVGSSSPTENSKGNGGRDSNMDDDGSPGESSLTPPSTTASVPTPSSPSTLPNCTNTENCISDGGSGNGDVLGEGKDVDYKVSQLPTHHRHLLQSHNPGSMGMTAMAMHNDLHALARGSNGASTGSASPASDATSSTGAPLSGHSPLTNNIQHDSELSSHSFEDNSPTGQEHGVGVVIARENNHTGGPNSSDKHDNLKESNSNDTETPSKEQEPHKNVIHVGYALTKEPSLNNLLSDKFLKGLGGMPFLAKPGSMESDEGKGVSLSGELLGKKGLLKSQAMMQEGDGRNQEVQETCADEDLLPSSGKAHLNLTRCISIPSKLLGRSDLKLHDKGDNTKPCIQDPVNGNDTDLCTDLKYSAVGIRTALWLGPDQTSTELEATASHPQERSKTADVAADEARLSDTACTKHMVSEGSGGGDPDPEPSSVELEIKPDEDGRTPGRDKALEDKLPGEQDIQQSNQGDEASVDQSVGDQTNTLASTELPAILPSDGNNQNQTPDLVRPEGSVSLVESSVTNDDQSSLPQLVVPTSSTVGDSLDIPLPPSSSSLVPSHGGFDYQPLVTSSTMSLAQNSVTLSAPTELPSLHQRDKSASLPTCDSSQLPIQSTAVSQVTRSALDVSVSMTSTTTQDPTSTNPATSSATVPRQVVPNCHSPPTEVSTSTSPSSSLESKSPAESAVLLKPQIETISKNSESVVPKSDLTVPSSSATVSTVSHVVTKSQSVKTVRITPPPGISLAPPPLTTKSEPTSLSLVSGHRVVVAPSVSTRIVTSLSQTLRQGAAEGTLKLVEEKSKDYQEKSPTEKGSDEARCTSPVQSSTSTGNRNSGGGIEQQPETATSQVENAAPGSTSSTSMSSSTSLTSPVISASPVSHTQTQLVVSSHTDTEASTTIVSSTPTSGFQVAVAAATSRTVPPTASMCITPSVPLVSVGQELPTVNMVPSSQILSRLAPQTVQSIMAQVATPTVMTVVMPQIVPPLVQQGQLSAISRNSDTTGHAVSIRDMSKEKDVVSLIANSTENDSNVFVKCIPHGSDSNAVGELTGQIVSPSKDQQQATLPAGPEGANGTQDQNSLHYQQQQRRQLQSKGISILKPLFDRDNEPLDDADLEAVSEMKWSRTPKKHNSNVPLDAIVPAKGNSQYTIAQILEKRKMKVEQNNVTGQQPLPPPQAIATSPQDSGSKAGGGQQQPLATSIGQHSQQPLQPISSTPTTVKSALTNKPSNMSSSGLKPIPTLSDYPRNSSMHLSNFMAKSMHTPPLINSNPHPMTAPGFALNLTESVQKVMSAIPCDSLSPPLHPPRVNRPHSRSSVSPAAKEKPVELTPGGELTQHGSRLLSAAMLPTSAAPTQLVNSPTKLGAQRGVSESTPKDTAVVKKDLLKGFLDKSLQCVTQPVSGRGQGNMEMTVKSEDPAEAAVAEADTKGQTLYGPACAAPAGSSTTSMQLPHSQTSKDLATPISEVTLSETLQAAGSKTKASPTPTSNSAQVKTETPSGDNSEPLVSSTVVSSSTVPEAATTSTTSKRTRSSEREEQQSQQQRPGRIASRRNRESTESQGKEREESPRVTPTRGRKKSASESSDATMNSEASSEGMTLRGGRSTDRSSERSESPPPTRTTRSTRSVRKKTSPDGDDALSTSVVEVTERSESPKPTKQTRGSKRRLELDDGPGHPVDKKAKTEEGHHDEEGVSKQGLDDDLTGSEGRSKGSNGGGNSGKATRAGSGKGGAKDDQDDKISPKGKKTKEEMKDTEEQSGSKRGAKTKVATEEATGKKTAQGTATRRAAVVDKRPKSPPVTDDKLSMTGRVRNRTAPMATEEAVKGTDGDDAPKRATRSTRSKADHCELLPPVNKRRRSSRDHR